MPPPLLGCASVGVYCPPKKLQVRSEVHHLSSLCARRLSLQWSFSSKQTKNLKPPSRSGAIFLLICRNHCSCFAFGVRSLGFGDAEFFIFQLSVFSLRIGVLQFSVFDFRHKCLSFEFCVVHFEFRAFSSPVHQFFSSFFVLEIFGS